MSISETNLVAASERNNWGMIAKEFWQISTEVSTITYQPQKSMSLSVYLKSNKTDGFSN